MSMTVESIQSPSKYIQGAGILNVLKDYVKNLGKSFLIVSDPFVFNDAKSKIDKSFENDSSKVLYEKFNGECTQNEIDRLIEVTKKEKSDAVIAIGGGKTLDTVKAIGYYANLPVVIIPTLASCDAPCTALAVIYKENGEFSKYLYLPQNPNMVIVDTDIILGAPVKFLAAGIGDAFATYYEARACYRAGAVNLVGTKITNAAMALAEACRETLLKDGLAAKDANEKHVSTKAFENIVEANIYLSGVGAESSGLAAAHAISNGLTVIPELHHVSHGEKVGFGTTVQLVLEGVSDKELKEAVEFMASVGLPVTLQDMGLKSIDRELVRKAAELSCAKDDTMGHMPFEVTVDNLCSAIIDANKKASEIVENMKSSNKVLTK
jgi:glycerol dehydrogenase